MKSELDQSALEIENLQKKEQELLNNLNIKDEAIEMVGEEVAKIQHEYNNDKKKYQEQKEACEQLEQENDELVNERDTKNEEIRLLIEKMNEYKQNKDKEILKLRKKLAGAEEDIKVLIIEQER